MKNLNLLVWISQLGISVALPLGGFVWLSVWLRSRFHWGVWVVIVGVVLGIICAVNGLRSALKTMDNMAGGKKKQTPPVSFNDHD